MSEPERVHIDSVENFLAEVEEIKESNKGNYVEFLFRGQANFEWRITSTGKERVDRNEYTATLRSREEEFKAIVRHDRKLINEYEGKFSGEDDGSGVTQTNLGVLAKVRHFRGANSLIDFTDCPLVALWFACSDKTQLDQDGVVYMLGIKNSSDFIQIDRVEDLNKYTIEEIFSERYDNYCFYWRPVSPIERMSAQRSCLVTGRKNTHEEAEKNKIIVIRSQDKKRIEQQLSKYKGINRSRLFPDLNRFAALSNFSEAYEKHVPLNEKESIEDDIRSLTREIEEIKIKLQNPTLQERVGLGYILGERLLKRGRAKSKLGDKAGATKDFQESKEVLVTPRNIVRKRLEEFVGIGINFDRRKGTLEEIVSFVRNEQNEDRAINECVRLLKTLGNIESKFGGYTTADIIIDTIIKLKPSEISEMYFIKAANYVELAESEKDVGAKISHFKSALEYLSKEETSYIEDELVLPKEVSLGLISSQIQKYLNIGGEVLYEYIKKELEYYKESLNNRPNNSYAMVVFAMAEVQNLLRIKEAAQEFNETEWTKQYREAIGYLSSAIQEKPSILVFRLARGTDIFRLRQIADVALTEEEKRMALEDLMFFMNHHVYGIITYNEAYLKKVRGMIRYLEKLD